MRVRPIGWDHGGDFIFLFGIDEKGTTTTVFFPRRNIQVLNYGTAGATPPEEEIVDEIAETIIRRSERVLIVDTARQSPDQITGPINAKTNPHGEINAFLNRMDIAPYEWLEIDSANTVAEKKSTADEEFFAAGTEMRNVDLRQRVILRTLYWDLEVWSSTLDQFPEPYVKENEIFMASAVFFDGTTVKGFLYHLGEIGPFEHPMADLEVRKFEQERDLIEAFLGLFGRLEIDRSVTFNGDGFDIPYLIVRADMKGVEYPLAGKFRDSRIEPLGTEKFYIPGVENIDLLRYFRLFWSGLPNYRLDTVGKKFLREGKRELPPVDMARFYQMGDLEGMGLVALYSIQDSVLLYKLDVELGILDGIEYTANVVRTTTEDVLALSADRLADRFIYRFDPDSVFYSVRTNPIHLRASSEGVYRNVYLYDYSELYLELMRLTPSVAEMADFLEGDMIPSTLIQNVFTKRIDPNSVVPYFQSGIPFSIEPFLMWTQGKIDVPWLERIDSFSLYVQVSSSSYITRNIEGEKSFIGTSSLCRPPFPLVEELVEEFLNTLTVPALPSLEDPKKLLQRTKVRAIENYKEGNYLRRLAEQYGKPILTWVELTWIRAQRGSILWDLYTETDRPDQKYYRKKVNDVLKVMRKILG